MCISHSREDCKALVLHNKEHQNIAQNQETEKFTPMPQHGGLVHSKVWINSHCHSETWLLLVLIEMDGTDFPHDEGRSKHDGADKHEREDDEEQVVATGKLERQALGWQASLAVIEHVSRGFREPLLLATVALSQSIQYLASQVSFGRRIRG